MRLIRAVRRVYVPCDPEKPLENQLFRSVEAGLLALVHDDVDLPEDFIEELGKLDVKSLTKNKKNKE